MTTRVNNRMIDGSSINVLDYGADPTGVTDSSVAIQAALDSNADGKVIFPKGTYLSNNKLTLSEFTYLDLKGSTLKFVVDGSVENLVLNSNTGVENGTILNESTNGSGTSGQYQSPVLLGDFFNPVNYQNFYIRNLKIESNKPNGNGISVLGNCSNGTIENISFDGKGEMGRPVLLHWGNTQAIPEGGLVGNTGHPNNITVDNIKAINGDTSSTDAFVVFISGGFNIDVTNVDADSYYGCYQVSAGEPSNGYATGTIAPKVLTGLTTNNLTANRCIQPYKLSGLGNVGVQPIDQLPIGSIVMNGTNAYNSTGVSTSSALIAFNWKRAQLIGGEISSFPFYGIQSKFKSTYLEVSGMTITGCGFPAISIEGESGFTTQGAIRGCLLQQNGSTGTSQAFRANINLNFTEGVSINGSNRLGSSLETAENHIYASDNSLKVLVDDNIIKPTASGAALYSTRSSTPANCFFSRHVAANNRYDAGVVPTEGGWCVEVKSGNPVALVPYSAQPGSGDGAVGYEVEFEDATSGQYKRVVKINGSTWKGYGLIET